MAGLRNFIRRRTIAVALLALVIIASGTAIAAGQTLSANAPEPLESGPQEVSVDETVTYNAKLGEGDELLVGAWFGPDADLKVTVYDSAGEPVGEEHSGDDHSTVYLPETPTEGTYTVEVENVGTDDVEYFLDVTHTEDEPEPGGTLLESGYYERGIDAGETVTHVVELEAGEEFATVIEFDPERTLELTMYDPSGERVGEGESDDGFEHAYVPGAGDAGTYTVEVTNDGTEEVTYGQHVDILPADDHDDPDGMPDPLESGLFGQEIDAGETVTHSAELEAGGGLLTELEFDPEQDLELTVYDPSGERVGEMRSADGVELVYVPDVERTGTHTVEVTNDGTEEVAYGQYVDIRSADEHDGGMDDDPAEDEESYDDPAEDEESYDDPAEDQESYDDPAEDQESYDDPAEDERADGGVGDGDDPNGTEDLNDTDGLEVEDDMPGLGVGSALLGIAVVATLLLGRSR